MLYNRNYRGFTLVDVVVTIAILAILLGSAVPSFNSLMERNRLINVVRNFRSNVNFSRTESIKRNTATRFSFNNTDPADWCYGLKLNTTCDCKETDSSDPSYCEIDGAPWIVSSAEFPGTKLVNNVLPYGGTLSINPVRGTIVEGAGNVTFSTDSMALRIVTSGLGHMNMCSPTDTQISSETSAGAGVHGFGTYSSC